MGKSLEKTSRGSIRRTIGNDLLSTIRDLATKDFEHSIIELVANSYDADATTVDVEYEPRTKILRIKDNGEGMTPEDLENFFRSGDSEKRRNPITPMGRTKLGKFGIATILINHLADSYEMETYKSGLKTTLRESFDGELSLEKDITFSTEETGEGKTGTEIKLTGLRIKDNKILRLGGLIKRIRWDLPVHLPDFKVYVNGEEVEPRKIGKAVSFEVDEKGKNVGEVKGEFYLLNSSDENAGIHLYVNGRRIGNPLELLNSFNLRIGTSRRLMGIVHANGLENAIGFDRTKFKEDDPSFAELREILQASLREIDRYGRDRDEEKSMEKRGENLAKAIEQTSEIFSKKRLLGNIQARLSLTENSDSHSGGYTPEKGEIQIPLNHPSLRFAPRTRIETYVHALEAMAIDAIALYESESQENPLSAFNKKRFDLWRKLNGMNFAASEQDKKINPKRMYSSKEAKEFLGLKRGEFGYVFDQKAISIRKNGRVSGEEIRRFEEKTRGMLSLYNIVSKLYDYAAVSQNLAKLDRIIQLTGKDVEPIIRDLSLSDESSCFYVDSICNRWVSKIFREDIGRKTNDPVGVLNERLSRLCLLEKIPEVLEGVSEDDLINILKYAAEKRLNLKPKAGSKMYLIKDIVRVVQHQRGN